MLSSRLDPVEAFGHVRDRSRQRVDGLGDDEWRSQPTSGDRLTLSWRPRPLAESALLRDLRPARP